MPTGSMKCAIHQLRDVLLRDVQDLADSQLLDSFVAARDEVAFEIIVRRHGPMVLGLCRRILGNVHDAEDAFQAVFLVFARKAASISRRELLANWLYGVAHRTALAARGKMARRRSHEIQVKDIAESVAPDPGPCDDWLSLLDAELSSLPDKYRIPIVLCDLEGRTRQDAARQLKIPEGTLSSRLATARKRLADRLTRRGTVLSGGALAAALAQSVSSAAISTVLMIDTVKTAATFAAGNSLAVGAVSESVVALAEGVLKSMFVSKLKIGTWLLLGLLCLATGTGMLTAHMGMPDADALDQNQPMVQEVKPAGDSERLKGTWKVVKDEYPDATKTKWLEAPVGADFTFVFTGDKVTRTHQNTSDVYRVTLNEKEKGIELRGLAIRGIAEVLRGIYTLDGDNLTLCITDSQKRPTDFSPKEPAQRRYHLQRVAAKGKNGLDQETKGDRNAKKLVGRVIAVSKDGKSFTFEGTASDRPAESVTIEVKIGQKTAITYHAVAAGGAKPTVGYAVGLWMDDTVQGLAARIGFGGSEGSGADVNGLVVDVDKDGKGITLLSPLGGVVDGGAKPKQVHIRFNEKTVFAFSNVVEGGARIEKNQSVYVWYPDGKSDNRIAGQVEVFGSAVASTNRPHHISGKLLSIDEKTLTIEQTAGAGEEKPKKVILKIGERTTVVYHNVGPGGAKPAAGHYAQIWLKNGSKDTVTDVALSEVAPPRWMTTINGRVVGVSDDRATITVEQQSAVAGEKPKRVEIKITNETRFAYGNVGPDGARLTVGHMAWVRLLDGSKDTAAQATFEGRTTP